MDRALIDRLPPPLPTERIIALNRPGTDLAEHREYEWNGWSFDVPPGVFLPGATSRIIHDRLLDGTIDVRDRTYAAMGVGLGVEAVLAGLRGARTVFAVDVHRASVDTTRRHYRRFVADPDDDSRFVGVVSDTFDGFPGDTRLEVVTFNPPAVRARVSDDPDVVRNVCVGAPLVERFFDQLVGGELLAPGGAVYVVVSNTADLRAVVGAGVDRGLSAEVALCHDWGDGVLTYLFRFRQGGRA